MRLDAALDRYPGSVARADVFRSRPNEAMCFSLLECVRDPPTDSADRESWCKERHLQAESVKEKGRVELDVRLKAAPRFVFLQQANRRGFDGPREHIERHVTGARIQPF